MLKLAHNVPFILNYVEFVIGVNVIFVDQLKSVEEPTRLMTSEVDMRESSHADAAEKLEVVEA